MSNTGNYCSGMIPDFRGGCEPDRRDAAEPYRDLIYRGEPITSPNFDWTSFRRDMGEFTAEIPEFRVGRRLELVNLEFNMPHPPGGWLAALEDAHRDFQQASQRFGITAADFGEASRVFGPSSPDCKEVKLLKKLRQLFKFQVERDGCFENGLCAFVDKLFTEEKLTRKEVDLFIKLVQKKPNGIYGR